jgi:hypothetical protein
MFGQQVAIELGGGVRKAITHCDSSGGVVARHDPLSEQADPLPERRSEITPC